MTDQEMYASPLLADDEISLYALFGVLLKYRFVVMGAALLVGFVAAGAALIGTRSYTAEATFMPQGGGGSGAAGGIAALVAQSLPQTGADQSPQFYTELLGSRALLGRLLPDTFTVTADSRTGALAARGTLADLLQIEEEVAPIRRDETLRAVSAAISTSRTQETGMVRLEVTTPWAELSEQVARRLIELVNEFNLETRQTNAAAESRFVEERLAETGVNLRRAEEELRAFLEANRRFQNSPQLVFEHDRLERQVLHQQQLYTGLQQSLEAARIAQVRDTPLITVVGPPERPVYPDSRRVRLRAILGILVGGMLGVFFSLGHEFLWKAYRSRPGIWSEMHGLDQPDGAMGARAVAESEVDLSHSLTRER